MFNLDNLALVSIVNKRTSMGKLIIKLICPLVFLTMLNNIQLVAVHISSSENKTADKISRFQMERFRALAPSADLLPAPIPHEFLTII